MTITRTYDNSLFPVPKTFFTAQRFNGNANYWNFFIALRLLRYLVDKIFSISGIYILHELTRLLITL